MVPQTLVVSPRNTECPVQEEFHKSTEHLVLAIAFLRNMAHLVSAVAYPKNMVPLRHAVFPKIIAPLD